MMYITKQRAPQVGVYGAAHALDDDEVGAHRCLRQLAADPTQVQARAALPAGYHEQPRFPVRSGYSYDTLWPGKEAALM